MWWHHSICSCYLALFCFCWSYFSLLCSQHLFDGSQHPQTVLPSQWMTTPNLHSHYCPVFQWVLFWAIKWLRKKHWPTDFFLFSSHWLMCFVVISIIFVPSHLQNIHKLRSFLICYSNWMLFLTVIYLFHPHMYPKMKKSSSLHLYHSILQF